MSEYGSSHLLSGGLKLFAVFSMFTGSVDVILGHKMVIPASERSLLPRSTLSVLDNQLRFLGAIWAGYGSVLWWATNDFSSRQVPLSLLGIVLFLSGVGRLTSGLSYGWGAAWTKVAAGIELVFPPLIYLLGF
ncbi:hypothetical protein FSARC_7737 [Fusarium sarcochroum]|uniref:DUF4345 domain-containing protein n=1 Tax=Fusarium sarcochroum TaxID=1208366 RepID=A0A8H4TUL2_9HYPO|nr:hypothetical protein FSARC_7737 [Fusarium sarcochroum]